MGKFFNILIALALLTSFSTAQARVIPPVHVPLVLLGEGGPSDKLFENDKISISTAYPNPAIGAVYFDYRLSPNVMEARITISDIFGTTVSEHRLSQHEKKLKIETDNLASGVYFYTLSLEKKVVVTRKMIVRH